jgi:hypothetical protein
MLRCEECGKEARTEEEARGWRAVLTVVEEGVPEEGSSTAPSVPSGSSRATMADLGGVDDWHRILLPVHSSADFDDAASHVT